MTSGTPTLAATSEAALHGIPERRGGDRFATFEAPAGSPSALALDHCRKLVRGDAWCALLSGDFGTGKTHLAIATLLDWLEEPERGGYFWKVPDFLAWLRREAFGPDARWDIEELTEGYRTGGGLIVFDDLGTENPTEWAHEQLYRILDSRYDRRLPTVITTNQELSRIDGRILSRYREGLVVCRGSDQRKAKAAKA